LSIPSTSAISGATLSASTKASATQATGGAVGKGGKGRLMTPEEKKRVVEALTEAKTTEEVRKLERMLAEGLVPEGGMNGL
jgi:U2 small nuclear ribonucleoprotein A'